MDELSVELCKTNVGCNINGTLISHLINADDSVIMTPTGGCPQSLIDVCYKLWTQDNKRTM